LGQVSFAEVGGDEDSSMVAGFNPDSDSDLNLNLNLNLKEGEARGGPPVARVARLLGLDASALAAALTTRQIHTRSEGIIVSPQSVAQVGW
jgi:hypothetical protein